MPRRRFSSSEQRNLGQVLAADAATICSRRLFLPVDVAASVHSGTQLLTTPLWVGLTFVAVSRSA
jgi:hypothetical protein